MAVAECEQPQATAERRTTPTAYGAPWVWTLCVIEGQDVQTVHRIDRHETTLGRKKGATFVVRDDQISKQHCLVRTEGGVCTVMDLGSTNGTRLNNRELEVKVAKRLHHLDELEIGDTRLLVLSGKYKSKRRGPA